MATRWIKNLEKFIKALPWIGIAIDILDAFSIQKYYTYQLRIPNTNVVLTYQFTKRLGQSDDFDPSSFLRVLDIKKPSNATKYLYEGRYYPTLEMTQKNMKLDIIDNILRSRKATYYSRYIDSITGNSKEELMPKLISEIKRNYKNDQFLDHFGQSFSTADQALFGMLKHISEQEFTTVYTYLYGPLESDVFYDSNLESMEEKVLKTLDIDRKTVLWTDLLTTREFEKLEDVGQLTYEIYQVNINGKAYYFNSKSEATLYVMKVKNFKNLITRITNKTYTYKEQTFTNIEQLQEYILTNIKTYSASTEKEVKERVGY